ncbi:hypothetical protein EGW08_002902 [Elysia chlorotica]|uniref:G-protein coupled receptors family 1 profile domain-containing protein n=1 Tax=Elysia chlorotica TaxID=188477 RepID=A0A433U6C5_ELYCH|nr:hypothetical protein EGW08_002902 [Elysia chlorotica]
MSANSSEGPEGAQSPDPETFIFSPVALPDPLRYVYVTYLLLILVIGVPGNILIALVYGRTKSKNTCDWFILFMSVTDCTVCLLSPLLHLRYELQINAPWMRGPLCGIEHWLQLTAMLSSCHYLTAIAIDRYVKICNSRLPTLTPKMAPYACLLSVISSALICVYPSLESFHSDACGMFDPRGFETSRKVYFTLIFFGFVISFILVTFAYWNVCKQIFVKVKAKQRLMENNGLHTLTKSEHVEETEESHQTESRGSPCNRLVSRLIKAVRGGFCCGRHDSKSFTKSSMQTEINEQFALTNTHCLNRSNLSLNSDDSLVEKNQTVPVKTNEYGDDHMISHDKVNSKTQEKENTAPSASENHEAFLRKDEMNDSSVSAVHPAQQNNVGVGETKLTLLSLTSASWPSTEEEPTPSADVPVSFYLENLLSQAQNGELKSQNNKLLEINPVLKTRDQSKMSCPCNIEVNKIEFLREKPINFDGTSETVGPNVLDSKLSLFEDTEPCSILSMDNLKHSFVEYSVGAGGVRLVRTSVLKHSRSQPLPCSLQSEPETNAPGVSVVPHCHCPNSVVSNQSRTAFSPGHDSDITAYKQSSPLEFKRSISVDGLVYINPLRIRAFRASARTKTHVSPQIQEVLEVQNCTNNAQSPLLGGTVNLETIQHLGLEDQVLKVDRTLPSVAKVESVLDTVDKIDLDPTSVIVASPKNVINSLDIQQPLLVPEETNHKPEKSIPTPSRPNKAPCDKKPQGSLGQNLTVPSRKQPPSLKSLKHTNSIDSGTGWCTRDEDEIEEDLPTGSFMKKWRSQVRRKAKSRQRKGLTSSGKSMCSSTGKRFARERQITFMLISVTATFLFASAPSWAIWVVLMWEPSVLDRGLSSKLLVVITVAVNLLNYISSWFIIYAFNPSFRVKCRNLVPCLPIGKASEDNEVDV